MGSSMRRARVIQLFGGALNGSATPKCGNSLAPALLQSSIVWRVESLAEGNSFRLPT